jgi:hypothetical protein
LNCTNATDFCHIASCDKVAGCIFEQRICPNQDIGCFTATCDPVAQTCTQTKKSNFNSATGKGGITCLLLYDQAAKAAAITGGALAGVVIGAVAAAALIGFGGKKGYDYLMAKESPIGGVAQNPLYTPAQSSGVNPMFAS